jgi:hypothetical protein
VGLKFCPKHKKYFPKESPYQKKSEFNFRFGIHTDELQAFCKRCTSLYMRVYLKSHNAKATALCKKKGICTKCRLRKAEPKKVNCKKCSTQFMEWYYKWKFNLTREQVQEKKKSQGNCCAICNEKFTETPRVDHDHATNQVRDLLCDSCNVGLGRFKDNPLILRNAAKYIEKHKRKTK